MRVHFLIGVLCLPALFARVYMRALTFFKPAKHGKYVNESYSEHVHMFYST